MSYQIEYYRTESGKTPFNKWLNTIKAQKTLHKIRVAIARAENGNLSFYKRLSNGVFELKLPFGPGYRIYFVFTSTNTILILWAGTKQTQKQDIIRAGKYYADYESQGAPYA